MIPADQTDDAVRPYGNIDATTYNTYKTLNRKNYSKMRIKPGFELRNICGENIIIAHGVQNIDFSKVITLNESAAVAWNAVVGKGFTEQDIVNVLTREYEVDAPTAQNDANALIASWQSAGLIE